MSPRWMLSIRNRDTLFFFFLPDFSHRCLISFLPPLLLIVQSWLEKVMKAQLLVTLILVASAPVGKRLTRTPTIRRTGQKGASRQQRGRQWEPERNNDGNRKSVSSLTCLAYSSSLHFDVRFPRHGNKIRPEAALSSSTLSDALCIIYIYFLSSPPTTIAPRGEKKNRKQRHVIWHSTRSNMVPFIALRVFVFINVIHVAVWRFVDNVFLY